MTVVTVVCWSVAGAAVLVLAASYVCALMITSYTAMNEFKITPRDLGVGYEEFTVHGARGAEIACWFMRAAQSKGVVIASHGVADCRRGILPALVPLVHAGFSLVVYDMRHHGESTGRECTIGFWETEDLLRLTDHVKNVYARAEPICYWGFSLGGVVSLLAAARNHEIVGVVAQSPFVSMREVVAYYSWRFYFVPAWPVVRLALWWVRLRTGARYEDVDLRVAARRLKHTPVLLLGSPDDPQVPLSWLEQIRELIGPQSQLLTGPYGHYDGTVLAAEAQDSQADLDHAISFFTGIMEQYHHARPAAKVSC